MSKSVNKVILLGHTGKDCEVRTTPSGTVVVNVSLATSERQKDAQGNYQDRTEWHNLVAFNRTAEIMRDYVKKGSKIFIEGKLQTRDWNDKNTGEKRYRTEILVNDLTLLSGRGEEGAGAGQNGSHQQRSNGNGQSSGYAQQPAHGDAFEGADADDIPF